MKPQNSPTIFRKPSSRPRRGRWRTAAWSAGPNMTSAELLYTCPKCKGLFMLVDKNEGRLRQKPGAFWRRLFDYRKMLNVPALKGVFLFYELIAPVIPLDRHHLPGGRPHPPGGGQRRPGL